MKVLKHLINQPFIAATGAAALAHSTWALGTLFAGSEPTQFTPAWGAWLVPALLIAFALDVGQIATSGEIREGERTRAKYITFIVFAIATYYLQWVYMAHHMPALQLGAGVRSEWDSTATLFRDLALWFIPALLPLSTTLYTLSGGKAIAQPPIVPVEPARETLTVFAVEQIRTHEQLPAAPDVPALTTGAANEQQRYPAVCADCGWEGEKVYSSEQSARQALIAHSRHCVGKIVLNGHHKEELA